MGICESKTPGGHVCIVLLADNSTLPIGLAILLCQPLELCHWHFILKGGNGVGLIHSVPLVRRFPS